MARLEELSRGASVKGILPNQNVVVVDVAWHGSNVVELTYKDSGGRLANELLYRDREPTLEVVAPGRVWSFESDGALFRLVSEAYRIRLAYLFDPVLAVHTSLVEPLPHQITAVYGEMLNRQPLRFLLADDPGAGKTIMAGLLIKELIVRGDLQRCLIVCPGMLVEQWQDELDRRFHLPFEIMTNDKLESARSGNWFSENPLAICRLDKLSRNEDLQAKLEQTDWDLVVVDEAHKMSASFFGGEVKETKRYKLGKLLSRITRHFLLMTATPHNGKEEDFQLFMALIDGDRFEGRFRDGVHVTDVSDLMRRMVKENLLKFDGTRLFPERLAYTVAYKLSPAEADLYKQVTDYVREEFNRADSPGAEGRRGTVGFALTTLQRRLASSPEAIYQSLRRRRERLENRLREERLLKRGAEAGRELSSELPPMTDEDIEELDEAPDSEIEAAEDAVVDLATAAAGHKSFKRKGDDRQTPPDDPSNPSVDFHGERRSNATHQSTTDPEARLARKGPGKEARLCYAGHVQMDNRHGLVVNTRLTQASGIAESTAALAMAAEIAGRGRVTLGADKGYDQKELVRALREYRVTPHVAQKVNSAIDRRSTRHPGYLLSQRRRKRVEEIFGWLKTVAGLRKTRHRGIARVGWTFAFAAAVYNLVRMRKLLVLAT